MQNLEIAQNILKKYNQEEVLSILNDLDEKIMHDYLENNSEYVLENFTKNWSQNSVISKINQYFN